MAVQSDGRMMDFYKFRRLDEQGDRFNSQLTLRKKARAFQFVQCEFFPIAEGEEGHFLSLPAPPASKSWRGSQQPSPYLVKIEEIARSNEQWMSTHEI